MARPRGSSKAPRPRHRRRENLPSLSTEVLRLRLQALNLPITGGKAELTSRLKAAVEQPRPTKQPPPGRVRKPTSEKSSCSDRDPVTARADGVDEVSDNSSSAGSVDDLAEDVKQSYLTSITRNSNSTDKPEVDGALILLPPLHQCSVLRVFKATKLYGKERSRNKDARSGNQTQDLLHQGRALTDCAILAFGLSTPQSVTPVQKPGAFSEAQMAAIQDTVRLSVEQALNSRSYLPVEPFLGTSTPNTETPTPHRQGAGSPLGLHRPLDRNLEDKILRGEYIDFTLLLPDSLSRPQFPESSSA